MAYKLTANKTKMHALVETFLGPEVPKLRNTEFTKSRNRRRFRLMFTSNVNYQCRHELYLSEGIKRVLLVDEWTVYGKNDETTSDWKTYYPSLEQLLELGMLEEIPDLRRA